jgi:methionyl-tRNA synthetase
MSERFLVTAALPYVNGVPHLGHLISTHLPSDVLARYLRLKYGKENVLHIGGTDEHGTATELKALEEGVEPKALCDKYYPIHKNAYDLFKINYDFFGRTTLPLHYLITQEFFLGIFKAGLIKEVKEDVFVCKESGQVLADRYVEGTCPKCGYDKAKGDQCEKCGALLSPRELINPKSKYCNSEIVVKTTYNLALDLPKIKEELINWIKNSPFNEFTKKWALALAENIKERTITRDLKFGVPLPFEKIKKILLKKLLNQKCFIKEKVEKNLKETLGKFNLVEFDKACLLYTSPSPRD